ncbi:NADH:ubiquinone oxidoreductase intermediate-associated protein 30,Galactose-binding domain-like [Cinara cedri]|uniref:NADH:ubiquinone oxidoreductase intermediate-associated protein 30,Galactose-binding domain-like n=1 Tax=Cinara cedri TaxID=506608 RepID=A0A5E4MBM8_9HEMI|nr:NADH:ubiquinone oxidoreductase intermediate-associated protein 30,Galactose-binding domain-like [Cinara cedri]
MQSAKRFTIVLLRNRWKNIYINLMKNNTWHTPNTKQIHTSHATNEFHEYDKRSGYDTGFDIADTKTEKIRLGFKQLKKEIKLWKQEMKELLEFDPILDYRAGEVDVFWRFYDNSSLDHWIATSDSDHAEGFSKCDLKISDQGYGLFSGNLCSRVPKDGKIQNSGYCNIITKRVSKSFQRDTYLDWSPYTHLNLRLRGDGRSYLINIHVSGQFDIMWNDVFTFVLYTRGGPYWQTTRIPFSKFFFASKGRIQDKQAPLPLAKVTHFGITTADRCDGPFQLEIDYIGADYDPTHTEETAYEMYNIKENYIIGT